MELIGDGARDILGWVIMENVWKLNCVQRVNLAVSFRLFAVSYIITNCSMMRIL